MVLFLSEGEVRAAGAKIMNAGGRCVQGLFGEKHILQWIASGSAE
jgi:hypothetical protein